MCNLREFVKMGDATLENYIYQLYNNYVAVAGYEEEGLFNLSKYDDFKAWCTHYDMESAHKCLMESKYWVGGTGYAVKIDSSRNEMDNYISMAYPLKMNEETLEWLLNRIENSIDWDGITQNGAKQLCFMYDDLIDFVGFVEKNFKNYEVKLNIASYFIVNVTAADKKEAIAKAIEEFNSLSYEKKLERLDGITCIKENEIEVERY